MSDIYFQRRCILELHVWYKHSSGFHSTALDTSWLMVTRILQITIQLSRSLKFKFRAPRNKILKIQKDEVFRPFFLNILFSNLCLIITEWQPAWEYPVWPPVKFPYAADHGRSMLFIFPFNRISTGKATHLEMWGYWPEECLWVDPIFYAKIILGSLKTHCQMSNGDAEEDLKMPLTVTGYSRS